MAMTLNDFAFDIRALCVDDLVGVVLYGSAAGRDYHASSADQNVLILLRSADADRLRSLSPVVRRWIGAGNPPPLILTLNEWQRRSDVFAIEYSDLLERHRVLVGDLPTDGVVVHPHDLRLQLESESMGKLLRFRRGLMSTASDADKARELLDDSLSSILALLRATVHLHGETPPPQSDDLVRRAGALAGFDPAPVLAVLAARRGGASIPNNGVDDVARGYLGVLEQLVAHVDTLDV